MDTHVYAQEQIDEIAKEINGMEHYSMCSAWRFAKDADPRFRSDLITTEGKSLGTLFKERLFDHFGGFTPDISKSLGWHQ